MHHFDKTGKLAFVDIQKFNNDKDFYKKIWLDKYNVKLKTKNYGPVSYTHLTLPTIYSV